MATKKKRFKTEIGEYLTDEEQYIFKQVLTVKDYNKAADEAGYKSSTANNIMNQLTKVTSSNVCVYDNLRNIAIGNLTELCKLKSLL